MEHRKLISTKADTLFALRSLIHESVIEEMYILQVGDYHRDKIGVCMRSWISSGEGGLW